MFYFLLEIDETAMFQIGLRILKVPFILRGFLREQVLSYIYEGRDSRDVEFGMTKCEMEVTFAWN